MHSLYNTYYDEFEFDNFYLRLKVKLIFDKLCLSDINIRRIVVKYVFSSLQKVKLFFSCGKHFCSNF